MSDLMNTTAPAPPPEAFAKDLPIGQPVSQDMTPVQTVWARLSDGRIASLPASSFDALQKADQGAQILPTPKPGEALVKLEDGKAGTLPLSSLDAARQKYPDLKILANGSDTAGTAAEMQTSSTGSAYGAVSSVAYPVITAGSNLLKGVGEGAIDTVATADQLGRKYLPDFMTRGSFGFGQPTDIDAEKRLATPDNATQSIGKGLEGIAEFVAGDEALKGITLGDRLLKVGKVAEAYESASPAVKSAMDAAMRIARTSAVSAGQSALHPQDGQSEGDAALQGAAYGLGGGLVGEGLGVGANYLFKKTPAAIEAAAREGVNKTAMEADSKYFNTQFGTQTGVAGIAADAAEAHGAALEPIKTNGQLITFNDAAAAIRESSEPVFDGLRQATPITDQEGNTIGNMFDRLTTEIKAAKKVIYGQPSSAEVYLNAEQMLKTATVKLNGLFAAGVGGISKEDLAAAKTGWAAQDVLDDLGNAIDKAYTRAAGIRNVSVDTELPEINPAKFVNSVNNAVRKIDMTNPAALTRALGAENLASLAELSNALQNTAKNTKALAMTEQGVRQAIASGKYGKSAEGTGLGTMGAGLASGSAGFLTHLIGFSNPVSAGVGLSLGTLHWLYTHPTMGVKILQQAQKAAPIASQAVKQAITHTYNPDTNSVEPVQQ